MNRFRKLNNKLSPETKDKVIEELAESYLDLLGAIQKFPANQITTEQYSQAFEENLTKLIEKLDKL